MDPGISIVVPLFNEGPNVLPLAQRVFLALGDEPGGIELLLVDDGSTDETWPRILEARSLEQRIRALRHRRRAGQSAALWTGLSASRGSVIATLDGDLQNNPADLPWMLALLANCDMVCGVRTKRKDNLVRRLSSRVARWARKQVLDVDFRDTGSNLRVFKRSLLQRVTVFDGFHRFLPILAHSVGAVVREVPVPHYSRTAGYSKYGVWNRLGRGAIDLLMVRWLLKRQLPSLMPLETPTQEPMEVRTERTAAA